MGGGIKCRLAASGIALDNAASIKHIVELATATGGDIGLPG